MDYYTKLKNYKNRQNLKNHGGSHSFIWLSDVHIEPRYNRNFGPSTFCLPNNTFSSILDQQVKFNKYNNKNNDDKNNLINHIKPNPYKNQYYNQETPFPTNFNTKHFSLIPMSNGEISPSLYFEKVYKPKHHHYNNIESNLNNNINNEKITPFDSNGNPHYKFGQFGCDAPEVLVESALDDMKGRIDDPAFILFSGDFGPHNTLNADETYTYMGMMIDLLDKKYPQTVVYPVIGNNDVFPDFYLPLDHKGTELLQRIYSLWQNWLPPTAKETFLKGGYYSAEFNEKLKIIVLNTLYYSSSWCNNTVNNYADPVNQFAWLEKELSNLLPNQQVIISAHVPPGYRTEFPNQPLWQPQFIPTFENIISKYSNVIAGMYFGHVHRDDFKLMFSENSTIPYNHIRTAGSISLWLSNNPSYQIWSFNENTTFEISDYSVYYTDVALNNLQNYTTWKKEYSAWELYGHGSISTSLLSTFTNMIQEDLQRFIQYAAYRTCMFVPTRFLYYCTVDNIQTNPYDQCLADSPTS